MDTNVIALLEKIKKQAVLCQYVYIFGAGFRAKVLTGILLSEIKDVSFYSAVITNKKRTSVDFCWDIPVVELQEIETPNEDTFFLIGTVEAYVKEICMELEASGYTNYIHIAEEEFQRLKSRYVSKRYEEIFQADVLKGKADETVKVISPITKIYMVKSEMDKEVIDPKKCSGMISIQGGSALSGRKIAELRDDTGINISERNRQWNEFTVIYWLWKHAVMDSEYIGLCHYRRIFDADKVENRIKKETPDVILAEPEVLFPSIEAHYCSLHYEEDFSLMKKILRLRYPEYYTFAERYFSQELFIPYNMIIARNTVFAEYAEWIFPLLEEIELQWRPHGDAYEDRAVAFLGEWLTGVYFLYHRKRLKILYSKIRLLETR